MWCASRMVRACTGWSPSEAERYLRPGSYGSPRGADYSEVIARGIDWVLRCQLQECGLVTQHLAELACRGVEGEPLPVPPCAGTTPCFSTVNVLSFKSVVKKALSFRTFGEEGQYYPRRER